MATGEPTWKQNYPTLPRAVRCPFCGEGDTRLEAPFGGLASVAQYYCRRCRSVFEWMRWEGDEERDRRPDHPTANPESET